MTATSSPRFTRRSARVEPMNPAPPVMKIFILYFSPVISGLGRDGARTDEAIDDIPQDRLLRREIDVCAEPVRRRAPFAALVRVAEQTEQRIGDRLRRFRVDRSTKALARGGLGHAREVRIDERQVGGERD